MILLSFWMGCVTTLDELVPIDLAELALAPVFDPEAGPLRIDGSVHNVVVLDADGEVVRALADGSWDGLDAAGDPAPVGAYTVRGTVSAIGGLSRPAAGDVALVRVGFDAVYAEGDDDIAVRVPLFWHGDRILMGDTTAIATADLDGDGFGPVWASLKDSPDDGATQPVAWTTDSRPILTFTPGQSKVRAGSNLDGHGIRVEIPGWTVLAGSPLADGVPVVMQKDTPLSETLGVIEETLPISFVVASDEGPLTVATQGLPVRFYATFGPETFNALGSRYNPWVAALDPALRGIQGTAPDHDAVLDALVEWIYTSAGLRYDTTYGASVYVDYASSWTTAHFQFSGYLDRDMGTVVNCTDCAAILGAYANMLGAQLDYTIILQNFPLNQIKAIGIDSFTNCPFGRYGCGFSYHAVTTDDAGGTIWDATLALDGDADPYTAPSEELLVQSIAGEEYLDRLTDGAAVYEYQSQGTIQ